MNLIGLLAIVLALVVISATILVYACLCVSSEQSRQEEKREDARHG